MKQFYDRIKLWKTLDEIVDNKKIKMIDVSYFCKISM